MSQTPLNFADLLRSARQGCSLATQELHDRFNHAVLAAGQRHLHHLIRSKVDQEDLAQKVWLVFFADILPTHDFDCPQQLVRFLGSMARNMALQEDRHFLKRPAHDVHLEQPLKVSLPVQEDDRKSALREQWE